jgi:hypothetical protein
MKQYQALSAALLLGVSLFAGATTGAQLCELDLDCILLHRNDTLVVPPSVVSLGNRLEHCSPTWVDENYVPGRRDTISVLFVIDHSFSMSQTDSLASRYQIVSRLIDSLHLHSPKSEVGIVVFSNKLMYDYHDDPYLVPLDTSRGWHDSYVPLTPLDTTIGGQSAVAKLKNFIALSATEKDLGSNRKLLNASYELTGRHHGTETEAVVGYTGGTDISLAFDAARKAFIRSRYAAKNRYIVFLSDGDAEFVDNERKPFINDYVRGTGLPTTYTTFWINRNTPIPDSIKVMTTNIAANGYSSNNPNSLVWKNQGMESDVFERLLNLTTGESFKVIPSTPRALTISGKSTTSFDSTHATFADFWPLDNLLTTFSVAFRYHYDFPWDADSTDTFTIAIERSDTRTPTPGLTTTCWPQATLALFSNQQPLLRVAQSDEQLQVRITPASTTRMPAVPIVRVQNAAGSDFLTLTTIDGGSYFYANFEREHGSPLSDNVLQTAAQDSIVLIYRNPALPLDTLRIALAVAPPRDLRVLSAAYRDDNANGYPDKVSARIGTDTLHASDLGLLATAVSVQTTRPLAIDTLVGTPGGFILQLTEESALSQAPHTALQGVEQLGISRIPALPAGGFFPLTMEPLIDSMAPVIVRAELLDFSAPALRDTLKVWFSEPVLSNSSLQPFLFSHTPHRDSFALVLNALGEGGRANAMHLFIPADNQRALSQGDSIWMSVVAQLGDTSGNVQRAPFNHPRQIDYYLVNRILNARYLDKNQDGVIDGLRIGMDTTPTEALLDSLAKALFLPSTREFRFTRDSMHSEAAGLTIGLRAASSVPSTGVDNSDILLYQTARGSDNHLVPQGSVPITEAIAPVITRALYRPGIVANRSDSVADTLVVYFSERVEPISFAAPFRFISPDSTTSWTMQLASLTAQSDSLHRFIVLSSPREFMSARDSVFIDTAAHIRDIGLVQQSNPSNPRVGLEVREYQYTFEIHVSPNPFSLQNPQLSPALRQQLALSATKGQLIVLKPLAALAQPEGYRATLTIMDITGNVVVDKEDLVYSAPGQAYLFVWDGTNGNGRMVGVGSYLAVVTLVDKDGKKTYFRTRLGVAQR